MSGHVFARSSRADLPVVVSGTGAEVVDAAGRRYLDGSGKEQWARAVTYAPDGHPAERRPVVLAIQNKVGTRRVMELTSQASLPSTAQYASLSWTLPSFADFTSVPVRTIPASKRSMRK